MERAMGIEPTPEAWEARNKNLETLELAAFSTFRTSFNWKVNKKPNFGRHYPGSHFDLRLA